MHGTHHTDEPAWDEIALAIDRHRVRAVPLFDRLWRYYRNPLPQPGDRLAGQRIGLPRRLTGPADAALDDRVRTPDAVIENDIAWRIHTMVDFMFGKPVRLVSTARDGATREAIEAALDAVWEASGGVALLQEIALLAHVYGHADLVLRIDEPSLAALARKSLADPDRIAACIAIEVVDPTRAVPIHDPADRRRLRAFVIHAEREQREEPPPASRRPIADWLESWRRARTAERVRGVTEVFSLHARELRFDGVLAERTEPVFTAGVLPVVHIQNIAQPLRHAGLSDVEPLIPLQDELNTRLSDRAFRVTMQSFKMYLARGLHGFDRLPVGPGQIWSTDNPDASVEAFGGDGASPSEESHIREIRDALDKASAVPPLATGVVQGRVGNLSSANALKITLVGLLAKTERKRITYGRGIAEMSRLVLGALDEVGALHTDPRDRTLRLDWPDPLPTDLDEETLAAKRKLDLGVSPDRVLAELGYQPTDDGIT